VCGDGGGGGFSSFEKGSLTTVLMVVVHTFSSALYRQRQGV